MKAWIARDSYKEPDFSPTALTEVIMFFGAKPTKTAEGRWMQSGRSNSRWALPLSPFAPMFPGEIRQIEWDWV
ncbi:MAG: hypothetical protein OEQ39_19030 [Gammaproteobacteria bacterium]|nr:hypothetical protein [Gammaproteobacteria bacterium]